jgi:signal transduction histidine kinase
LSRYDALSGQWQSMKRRSKVGGKAGKAGRRKAATPNRAVAPKAARDATSKTARLIDSSVADLQKRLERQARELDEARQQQAASSEVLHIISASAGALMPAFKAIVKGAVDLCRARFGAVFRMEGDLLHLVTDYNFGPAQRQLLGAMYPMAPNRGHISGRAILTGAPVQIPDIYADEDYKSAEAKKAGFRSLLAAPLLQGGRAIGSIVIYRTEPGPFTERQLALLQTFADQAVIAIENARLLAELRQRTDDLTESLEQQTATSEILSVISSSPGELASVFQAILEKATRICEANFALSHLYENGRFRRPSMYNLPPAFAQANAGREPSFQPHRLSPLAQAARTKQLVHISDMSEQAAYKERDPGAVRMVELGGVRTILTVPMLKDEELIGTISIYRQEVRPFTEKQIGLLQSFAAQAVIAIENARLLNELRESLQQQTATADVLKVISRSQTNVQPVFDAIVSSAVRLLRGYSGAMTRTVADHIELVAFTSIDNAGDASLRAVFPQSLKSEIPHARAIRDRAPINIADTQTDPRTPEAVRAAAHARGYRSWVTVPLLRYDEAIGTISVTRRESGGFNDDEISLLRTFADQAVIAIENARLLDELQARNRDLTALGEVGRAVSSTLDLKVVLKTIVDRAVELSGTDGGSIFYYRQEAARFELGETSGLGDELVATIRRLDIAAGQTGLGEAIANRRPLQLPDAAQRPSNALRDAALEAGMRAALIVPLLGSEGALGVLLLQRRRTGDFSPSVVSLMQSFADQSAIALENARLFEEIAQKSRELEIASQHKSQFVANMSHELRTPLAAMLGYAELMQEGIYEPLGEKSLAALTRIRSNGKHLLGLINTVLDIAKIESGQFTLNMQEYSIETVVETVRVATESLAQNKKLALTTAVTKPLPIGIGDEQRLTQVLLNLVGNAIKFTDTGEVRVTAEAVDGHFAVSVVDTGPGIPEQERTRIFEQFHQVDDSNTKTKGGTGLGLAIAKQIVEMHGGRIWVDSTVGKGSTFRMELPIRAEKMIA